MKTFVGWASENKLELPPVVEGATKRQGIAHWMYPDGYIRSHYPDLYFTPSAADAILKMAPGAPFTKTKHHVSHETPDDTAIGVDGKVSREKRRDYSDS